MRVLGVDLGTVRIGLALSDPGRMLASPLETLPAGDAGADGWPATVAGHLIGIARAHAADTIVVGLPRSLGGRDTSSTVRSRRVVDALRDAAPAAASDAGPGLAVEAWDERLSSVEAERVLLGSGRRRGARRQVRDQVAATIILQSWLDARRTRRLHER